MANPMDPASPILVAGHYTIKWNNSTLGETVDGIKITSKHLQEEITEDATGQIPVDVLLLGNRHEVEIQFSRWSTPLIKALFPGTAGTLGSDFDTDGNLGKLAVQAGLAKSLRLEPANAVGLLGLSNDIHVFPLAWPTGDPITYTLANKRRVTACRFVGLRYSSGATGKREVIRSAKT